MLSMSEAAIHELFMAAVLAIFPALFAELIEMKSEIFEHSVIRAIIFVVFIYMMFKLTDFFDQPSYMINNMNSKDVWTCFAADIAVFITCIVLPVLLAPVFRQVKVSSFLVGFSRRYPTAMLVMITIRGTVWCLSGIGKMFSSSSPATTPTPTPAPAPAPPAPVPSVEAQPATSPRIRPPPSEPRPL